MGKLIKLGSEGEDVRYLQNLLKNLGYDIVVDGDFGPKTDKVVKEFQKSQGLDVDGIVGPNTLNSLEGARETESYKLKESDFSRAALELGVPIAAVKAVQEVETDGKGGFFSINKPAILFEGHIFWSQLKKKGINPENHLPGNEDILYPNWTKNYYLGGDKEYNRLNRARFIDSESALCSASWGMFQIMGFNYKSCGYTSVNDFVDDMCKSEGKQLDIFVSFIKSNKLDGYLRNLDWAGFAKKYNGPGYKENRYDEKLEKAYKKYAV